MTIPPVAAWDPPAPTAYAQLFHAAPIAFLVVRAEGRVIVDANQPYLEQVELDLAQIAGRHVFDVFPESPENEDEQAGVVERLMAQAVATRRPTSVEKLRYDIPVGDGFEVRWWNVTEVPVLGPDGEVELLLHVSEDVTDLERARLDLDLSRVAQARAVRVATIQAEFALALTTAQTLADLQRLAFESLHEELGADATTVVTRADDGGWRVTLDGGVDDDFRDAYATLAFDSDLPVVTAARRGTRIVIPDLAAGVAMSRTVADVHARSGRQSWVCLPLGVDGRRLGSLSVSWTRPHAPDDDELELLEAVGSQCALAVDRIEQTRAQRRAAAQLQTLAESLQNAMLPTPPSTGELEIAVRYRSAADVAKVGGDWYDAFVQPDGAVMITIGDVVGHDHIAAGKMGQISGLLRALAFDAADTPHGVDPVSTLRRYEEVAGALGIDELATVVLARIEPDHDGHWVRWSNAGSPPPVLVRADGRTVLLDDKPDVMLGVGVIDDREEHVVHLPPGATLLLYTDGLIERRDASIDAGIGEVAEAMSALAGAALEELCDGVLDRLAPHIGEDDVAMIAVRPRPRG